jgi:hypothetical protein
MSQPGPKDPVVENVPNGERRAETSEHALHLRILQQERSSSVRFSSE